MVIVFEAINEDRKEHYVGATALGFEELTSRPLGALSPRLARWAPEERARLRIVENLLPPEAVADFVRHYAASVARAGWRVLVD